MKNVKITTPTGPVDNVKISFWRTFNSPPSNSGDYAVSADRNFLRANNTGAVGANLTLRGMVDTTVLGGLPYPPPSPPMCSAQLTKCVTANPASWTFASSSFNTTWNINPLADPRVLKGEFWFKLPQTNNDPLHLSKTKGIQVRFGPPPGPDDQQCPGSCPNGMQCQPIPKPWFGCRWLGLFCPAIQIVPKELLPDPVPPGPVPPDPLAPRP